MIIYGDAYKDYPFPDSATPWSLSSAVQPAAAPVATAPVAAVPVAPPQQVAPQQAMAGEQGGNTQQVLGFLGDLASNAFGGGNTVQMASVSPAAAYAMTPDTYQAHMTRLQGVYNQQAAQQHQARQAAAERQQQSAIEKERNRIKIQEMLQDQQDAKDRMKYYEGMLELQKRQQQAKETQDDIERQRKEIEMRQPTVKDGMQYTYHKDANSWTASPIPGAPVNMEHFNQKTGEYIYLDDSGNPQVGVVPGWGTGSGVGPGGGTAAAGSGGGGGSRSGGRRRSSGGGGGEAEQTLDTPEASEENGSSGGFFSDLVRGGKNIVNKAFGQPTNREEAVSALIQNGGQELQNGLIQMPNGKYYNVYGDGKYQELSDDDAKYLLGNGS